MTRYENAPSEQAQNAKQEMSYIFCLYINKHYNSNWKREWISSYELATALFRLYSSTTAIISLLF